MGVDVFVGRQAELAEVAALLRKHRLVTLTGTAGVGKTAVALRLARGMAGDFPGGVHVADLAGTRDDVSALAELLSDLIGASERPVASEWPVASGPPVASEWSAAAERFAADERPAAGVLDRLAGELAARGDSLIVFDAYDPVVGDAAILAGLLLRRVEGLRILAAGRQRLGLPGEQVHPVLPLPEDDAVRLLTMLAGDRLGGTDPRELCRRLDRLPLAITLAAARPCPGAADVLTAGPGDGRHGSMRDAFAWSHEQCTPAERLLWARASVFAAPFDLAAAQRVCAFGRLSGDELDTAFAGLVEKSILLRADGVLGTDGVLRVDALLGPGPLGREGVLGAEGGCGERHYLPVVARRFGAAELELLGESAETRRRHRDHFLEVSARAGREWPDRQLDWHRRLTLELPDLRAAVEHCYTSPGEHDKGLELICHLWFLWACCGRQALGDRLLQRGLDLGGAPGPLLVKARLLHAWVLIECGDLARAEHILADCAARSDLDATGYVRQIQAHLAVLRGDVGRALRLIKDARARHRSTGDVAPGLVTTYMVVATAMMLGGHRVESMSVLHEGRDLCRSLGDQWTLNRLTLLLAQAEQLVGNTPGAAACVRDSVRDARLFGDVAALVEGLEMSVVIAEACGADELAAMLLGASRAAAEEARLPPERCSPVLASLLRASELRLRGRVRKDSFERLAEMGGATALPAAVDSALEALAPLLDPGTAARS